MAMKVSVQTAAPVRFATPLLAVPVFTDGEESGGVPGLDAATAAQVEAARTRGDFTAKEGQTLLVYPAGGAPGADRILLVGAGKRDDLTAERLRRAGGTAAKQAARVRAERIAVFLPDSLLGGKLDARRAGQALVEGVALGAYTFTEMKSRPDNGEAPVALGELAVLVEGEGTAAGVGEGSRVGEILARAEILARDLGNLPGNVATPGYLAQTAERIASEHGMKLTVLGRAELQAEGMGGILGVAQGSEQDPKLIVLEHRRGGGGKPLVIVGKGVTFDSGGISIKPAASMEDMKFDMSGAGATLAAMQAIGELRVEADVIGVVPATENLLSGAAMKPGDILRSHLGKTIEVVNTDAEGRLILADALSYVRRFDPAAVIDAATLTGACVMALGHQASAVMGNDEALIEEVRAAGERVGQRTWPLPMFDEYREQIRSEYADIKNSGGRPAGTITAGWFLREFVSYPWVHLDIAGTAYGEGKLPYQTRGSTGVPTRLFVEWVLSRAG